MITSIEEQLQGKREAKIFGIQLRPGTCAMYSFDQTRRALTCLNVKAPYCERTGLCWIPPELKGTDLVPYECEHVKPEDQWAAIERLVEGGKGGKYALGERQRQQQPSNQ